MNAAPISVPKTMIPAQGDPEDVEEDGDPQVEVDSEGDAGMETIVATSDRTG